MRRDKKPKVTAPVVQHEVQHEAAIKEAARATRDLWKFRLHSISRDRDELCKDLHKRLLALGIDSQIVRGFYTGSNIAGFHVWLEGKDFLLDVTADTFNESPVYLAHISQARDSYKRD